MEQAPEAAADLDTLPTDDGPETAASPAGDEPHDDVFVHHGGPARRSRTTTTITKTTSINDPEDDVIDEVADEEEDEVSWTSRPSPASAAHIPEEDGVHVDTPEPEITDQIPDIQTALRTAPGG